MHRTPQTPFETNVREPWPPQRQGITHAQRMNTYVLGGWIHVILGPLEEQWETLPQPWTETARRARVLSLRVAHLMAACRVTTDASSGDPPKM
jgi:hypothetical protein